ncbi:MAG: SWIM zinc finger family protein, partial [Candidatus Angelobacter sp.]
MEAREQRGQQIAATGSIKRNGESRWLVPSQTSNARYFVDLANVEQPRCTCPDFEERRLPCK